MSASHFAECQVECVCGIDAFEELKGLVDTIPADPAAALVHIRAMYDRLTTLAVAAAEARWEGFEDLAHRLIHIETSLVTKQEPTA